MTSIRASDRAATRIRAEPMEGDMISVRTIELDCLRHPEAATPRRTAPLLARWAFCAVAATCPVVGAA